LELGLVLDDERLASGVDWGGERSGDGVVGGLGLGDEALVADKGGADGGLLDGPLADVREGLAADGGLLGRLARRPSL
jgi:hypothetical protein